MVLHQIQKDTIKVENICLIKNLPSSTYSCEINKFCYYLELLNIALLEDIGIYQQVDKYEYIIKNKLFISEMELTPYGKSVYTEEY